MNILKNTRFIFILLLSLLAFACDSTTTTTKSTSSLTPTVNPATSAQPLKVGDEIAVFETNAGKPIKLRLFPDLAPQHVASFKKYINEGFYNGIAFHRVIPGLVIQAGNPATKSDDKSQWDAGERANLPNIPAEFNMIPYNRGTLGAARTSDPNSASSQFFICLARNEQWDGQYTVFGEVIEGFNVAEIIGNMPRDSRDRPESRIEIKKAWLEKYQPK